MLNGDLHEQRFDEASSPWVRSFDLSPIKCLIVCRGPVRNEAIQLFDRIGIREYGILLSEKDSIVYPNCLAPELRSFRFPRNIHRLPDYMGVGQAEKLQCIAEIVEIARAFGYTHIFAGYGFMAEDAEFIEAIERSGVCFIGPSSRVARTVGAKDEARRLARSLRITVTPGVDDVSARALLRRHGDLGRLRTLAREHRLQCEFADSAKLTDNAERLLQAGYARNLELVTIDELQAEAARHCEEIWTAHPGKRIRFKHIGGGGGKGQRVIASRHEVEATVLDVLSESKVVAPGANRNFLIELNIEGARHNEIQLVGNGQWCVSLGGRDCSVQMDEQKLLEVSLTRELLAAEIEACAQRPQVEYARRRASLQADLRALSEMENQAEMLGGAVGLDSVSTFEAIVEGESHYFMEINTRIQVEHRVTEQVYFLQFANPDDPSDVFYADTLIETMTLLSLHGRRLPKPTRKLRHGSGAEVRINATNSALQPHPGALITSWSPPLPHEIRDDQGIGTPNPDTGAFVYYRVASAYDSNIALVITNGSSRRDNLEQLAEILRCMELEGEGLQTNLDVHYGLLSWVLGHDAMLKPSTQFMSRYLAAVGAVAAIAERVDLEVAWKRCLGDAESNEARRILALKQTLLLRPLARVLARPHALCGFLGLHDGRLFRREGNYVDALCNPVQWLAELYRFLNLDARAGRPPSKMIWDHDQRILDDALSFYGVLEQSLGTASWPELSAMLDAARPPAPFAFDPELWKRVQASHAGFQLGLHLLRILPRIGIAAGFFDVVMESDLGVRFPEFCGDDEQRAAHQRTLAPPPGASSDEVVAPMGGHYYIREAPHLPALIAEGDRFSPGQPLFVIEVMKMFNKISVPFGGRVTKLLLPQGDGSLVKKGQPILQVEPDARIVVEPAEVVAERTREATLALLGT